MPQHNLNWKAPQSWWVYRVRSQFTVSSAQDVLLISRDIMWGSWYITNYFIWSGHFVYKFDNNDMYSIKCYGFTESIRMFSEYLLWVTYLYSTANHNLLIEIPIRKTSDTHQWHESETPPPHPRAPASPAHPPHPRTPRTPAGAAGAGPAACNFRRHFRGTKEISVWDAAATAAALCIWSTLQKSKLFLIFS